MTIALYIVGAVGFIISIVAGFSSGSFMGFLISIAGGISSAIIFFALARITELQESILNKLEYQEEATRRFQRDGKKVCPNCNNKYDEDCNSCPFCGHRE